jgi:hypothetical protein
MGALGASATVPVAASAQKSPLRSRRGFASAMSRIKEGMSTADVLRLLGEPDDRLSEDTLWLYGTSGPGTFPTLGHVGFNERVSYFQGAGTPFADRDFPEAGIRDLVQLLSTIHPDWMRNEPIVYNPLTLIRIVNRLIPLGKSRCLALTNEFLRVSGDLEVAVDQGLVLRILFDVPKSGAMPDGWWWVSMPEGVEPRLAPRFPMFLVDDVPLLLHENVFGRSGQGWPVKRDVLFFEKHGTVRSQPLKPPDNPMSVVDGLVSSPSWIWKEDKERMRMKARAQVKLLLRDVLPRLEQEGMQEMVARHAGEKEFEQADARWRKAVEDVRALKPRWDAKQNRYVTTAGM